MGNFKNLFWSKLCQKKYFFLITIMFYEYIKGDYTLAYTKIQYTFLHITAIHTDTLTKLIAELVQSWTIIKLVA